MPYKKITLTDSHTGNTAEIDARTPINFDTFKNKPTIGTLGLPIAIGERVCFPEHDASKTYSARNIVKVNGVIYRCINNDTTSVPPSADWSVMVLDNIVTPIEIIGD